MTGVRSVVLALGLMLATPALADEPAAGLFKTELKGDLQAGKDGRLTLRIVPADGYHWNKDYPAKLKLTGGQKVDFPKVEYKKTAGEIQDEGGDQAGKVDIQARGKAAGQETVEALASFSVCNKDTCHLIRDRKLSLTVTVK